MSSQLPFPDPATPPTRRASSFLAALTVFATGAAALTYEAAWQRYLSVIVGTDHAATAATLAVFLGGLSLGYWLCGRMSERTPNPLRFYAGLEAAIGLYGLCFPLVFRSVERLTLGFSFSRPFGLVLDSVLAGLLLLLLPTLLMGATVPFMTRGLSASLAGLTGTHARVYALNALGAVAGALSAGFVLLPSLGLRATVSAAALVNLAAAVVLALLSTERLRPGEPARIARVERPGGSRFSPATLVALAALSGAATMSQENALIRLGGLVLGGTAFVFPLFVAAFVAAIAAGSHCVSKRARIGPAALWTACALSCAAWLALYPTYTDWPWLAHVVRVAVASNGLGFALYYAIVFLLLLVAVFSAVAPLGAVLPLVFHESRAGLSDSGRVAGALLGYNALGALAGSVCGGLLLFHVFDFGRVLLVAPVLTALMALLAARAAGRARLVTALALLVTSGVFLTLRPGFHPDRLVFGTYRMRAVTPASLDGPGAFQEARMVNRKLVHHEDDALVSVGVVESPAWDLPMPRPREIYINGKSDSSTLLDRETLRISAHLPVLFSPRHDRVLVIGQGTGVTAGELTLWPDVEAIELVELSPAVARTLPLFTDQTRAVERDVRFSLSVEDARHHLRRQGAGWNVIISEPSNLWNAGSDLLFADDFLRLIQSRLEPDGVLLQWLHLYETDPGVVCSVVATVREVFPHLRAFRGTPGDWLVVASQQPIDSAAEQRAREVLGANAEVDASLRETGVDGFDGLLRREVVPFPGYVERARERCPIHRAEDVGLVYRAGRALFAGTSVLEPELFGVD